MLFPQQLLLEHLPEDPDTDWMKYLVLEPDSDEELLISEITATPSQPTHLVDYPFNAAAASSAAVDFEATLPAFNSEVMLPDKEVITRKRDHNTAHIWSPHLDPITESSSLVHSDAGIINPNPVKPPAKKRETSPDGVARRCQHCATDKTPQWRAGPMGPKSLCNACGVRYKSGRLMPEYRPALSPTFAVSEHSNSHRKVCEIRRQKGLPTEPYPPVNEGAVAAREGAAATAIQPGQEPSGASLTLVGQARAA
ncbi:GATA transcription factor 9 [Platanthera guangdongensis]|uniref:GATA transcription factor 9 n=1 Tax=Platanthera guangdongensis TaxID=2320717 RepID=A0ABR2LM36_9ASPA